MKNNQAVNLSEPVYQYLFDMILSGQIKPGDKIPEVKIAAQFGISRTPIRDALKQLANDGIINIYPNRFAEVANWDDEAIVDIGVTRIELDNLAAKLAIYHGSNAEFYNMLRHSESCLEASNRGDLATRIKEDCTFHLELGYISKNKQLYEFQKKIYLKVEFLQSWRSDYCLPPEEQHKDHCDIIEALLVRDQATVLRLLTAHNLHFHDIHKKYSMSFFLTN